MLASPTCQINGTERVYEKVLASMWWSLVCYLPRSANGVLTDARWIWPWKINSDQHSLQHISLSSTRTKRTKSWYHPKNSLNSIHQCRHWREWCSFEIDCCRHTRIWWFCQQRWFLEANCRKHWAKIRCIPWSRKQGQQNEHCWQQSSCVCLLHWANWSFIETSWHRSHEKTPHKGQLDSSHCQSRYPHWWGGCCIQAQSMFPVYPSIHCNLY